MAIARYQKKISGPLLDRIDIHVEVPRVDYEKLADKRNVEDSKTMHARVQATRERQVESFLQIGLCLGIFPDASDDGGEPLLRAGKEYIGEQRDLPPAPMCVVPPDTAIVGKTDKCQRSP